MNIKIPRRYNQDFQNNGGNSMLQNDEALSIIEKANSTNSRFVRGNPTLESALFVSAANSNFALGEKSNFEGTPNSNPRSNVKLTLMEIDNPDQNNWNDVVDVLDFCYYKDKKEICIDAIVSLEHKVPKIKISGIVMQGDEEIGKFAEKVAENVHSMIYHEHIILTRDIDVEKTKVVLNVMYDAHTYGLQEPNIVEPLVYACKDYMIYTHERPTIEAHCITYQKDGSWSASPEERTGSKDNIVISLYRAPRDKSDCDYVCELGLVGHGVGLGIPFKGEIKLIDNVTFDTDISTECFIIRTGEKGGAKKAKYEAKFDNKFECAGRKSADMHMSNWSIPYEENGDFEQIEYNYCQKLKMHLKVGKTSFPVNATITSITDDDALYDDIKPFKLMRGCVEEDALIKMADGSLKKIKDIQIGDNILDGTAKSIMVRNVWKGPEANPCIRFTSLDGHELIVSGSHPMKTIDGWIRAKNINTEHTLLMEDGTYMKISSLMNVPYDKQVYNLSLVSKAEESNCFIANGFVVGDYECQNSI